MIVNAFLFAQPLQQGQVGFVVLNAKRPQRILPGRQFKAIAAVGQVMFLQQPAQDHRHAEVRKDAPGSRLLQRLHRWYQHQFVADAMRPVIFAIDAVQYAMNTRTQAETKVRGLLQQVFGGHGRCQAEYFDVEPIGLVEGLTTAEPYYLKAQVVVEKCQGVGTFLVVMHRTRFCHGYGRRGYETSAVYGHRKPKFQNRPTTVGEDVDSWSEFLVDCQL
ncbi:hypothetical protein D3C85_1280570 [compost metagenome]